ncbi:MAG: hypothetical protein K1Y02_24585 [Candidatus Hydrogenedentes bacterium]|nr:hypothetical protein [Candidatus Hydrogenedentota bacterium]
MSAIHLIEKNGTSQGLRAVNVRAGLWESGYWKVTEDTAKRLVGGNIYLHTGWADPSHFGGRIDSYTVHCSPGNDVDGKIIFQFTFDAGCRQVLAPPGANGEKRIFW